MRRTWVVVGVGVLVPVVIAVALAIGPAGSSRAEIRFDPEQRTIQQDLPDLSGEAHDEAALRAEGERVEACLASHGMTNVVNTFEFKGDTVVHSLRYDSGKSELPPEERSTIDLRCTARMAVLVTDFQPKSAG